MTTAERIAVALEHATASNERLAAALERIATALEARQIPGYRVPSLTDNIQGCRAPRIEALFPLPKKPVKS